MPFIEPDSRSWFELQQEIEAQQEALADKLPRTKLSHEVIVIIWKNHIRHQDRVGHAAIKMRNPSNHNVYASWWPDGQGRLFERNDGDRHDYITDKREEMNWKTNARLLGGVFQARDDQRLRYEDGEWFYTQMPSDKVYIPGIGVDGRWWGLHTQSMIRQWFNDYMIRDQDYTILSRDENCSGVARLLLKTGGGMAFAPQPPKGLGVVITPAEVLRWARDIERGINELNLQTMGFMRRPELNMIRNNQDIAPLFQGDTLPSDAIWRYISKRRNGSRGQSVKQIDPLLQKHFSLQGAQHLQKRMKVRVSIFKKAYTALQRHRDPHDALVLKAIAYRAATHRE